MDHFEESSQLLEHEEPVATPWKDSLGRLEQLAPKGQAASLDLDEDIDDPISPTEPATQLIRESKGVNEDSFDLQGLDGELSNTQQSSVGSRRTVGALGSSGRVSAKFGTSLTDNKEIPSTERLGPSLILTEEDQRAMEEAELHRISASHATSITHASGSTGELKADKDEGDIEGEIGYESEWKHRCAKRDRAGFIAYCDNSNPSADLFNCSQAECQVCLDLSWTCFPPDMYGDPNRHISTTLGNLRASEKCIPCRILFLAIQQRFKWDYMLQTRHQYAEEWLSTSRIYIELQNCFTIKVGYEPWDFLRWSFDLELYTVSSKQPRFHTDYVAKWFKLSCTDTASSSQPLGHLRPIKHIPVRPSAKYCADFINTNLIACEHSHQKCNIYTEKNLPTRVINVGSDATPPHLFESGTTKGVYITLSHCWGSFQPIQTTKETLSLHYNEIRFSALSKTFQDAILIARELGVEFLWIDSLCIIQDDDSDWQKETAQMAEIYENSLMTLAATAASDGRGGCLFSRWPQDVPLRDIDMDIPTKEKLQDGVLSDEAGLFIRRPISAAHRIIFQDIIIGLEHTPLLSRAWAYQETLLSPRTVHFFTEELIWECREGVSCECGNLKVDYEPDRTLYGGGRGWKYPFTDLVLMQKENRGVSATQYKETLHDWRKISELYSRGRLTYDDDRLPALAGLASRFSETLNTPYLAGIWLSDLWRGLLWSKSDLAVTCRLSGLKSEIPTWSWASIISMSDRPESIDYSHAREEVYGLSVDDRFDTISAKCSLLGKDPFGQITGGLLLIKGALTRGLNYYDEPNDLQRKFDVTDSQHVPQEVVAGDIIHYLILANRPYDIPQHTPKSSLGLILKNFQGRTYKRVGMFDTELLGGVVSRRLQQAEVTEVTEIEII